MEVTQMVSAPTGPTLDMVKVATDPATFMLATIWLELKPERVQESLAAGGADPVTLTLQLTIHQSQTVTFDLSGPRLAITFNNGNGNGNAAPPA